jgi:hypothetical protein
MKIKKAAFLFIIVMMAMILFSSCGGKDDSSTLIVTIDFNEGNNADGWVTLRPGGTFSFVDAVSNERINYNTLSYIVA